MNDLLLIMDVGFLITENQILKFNNFNWDAMLYAGFYS